MENKTLNVYVVGPAKHYASWLPAYSLCSTIENADLVLFTGGEDVSPQLYGERYGTWTAANPKRDNFEMKEFDRAKAAGKPILGICRGAQFLCVMAGGRLVQDQENRHHVHPIETYDEEILNITSSHHQAQYPYNLDPKAYKVIAWTDNQSKHHYNGYDEEISEKPFKEAEIVFYPTINALGIQGHPEYTAMEKYPDTMKYLTKLVKNLVNNSLNL